MSQFAANKNIIFFGENHQNYAQKIQAMDTYRFIRAAVAKEVEGTKQLLDIGNGLVFNYDPGKISKVVALDLFVDPKAAKSFPPNVKFKKGTALDLDFPDRSFDTVLLEMLLHHLVGRDAAESEKNVQRAIAEAFRVLKPRGKLIIVESCVPGWFYLIEKTMFVLTAPLVNKFLTHPMALQYPVTAITDIVREYNSLVKLEKIDKGRWVLQFGFKFPAALSPITPWLLVAYKN